MERLFFLNTLYSHQLIFENKNCRERKQTLVQRELPSSSTNEKMLSDTCTRADLWKIYKVLYILMSCNADSQDSSVSNSLTISSQCLSSLELHRLLQRKTSSQQKLVPSENARQIFTLQFMFLIEKILKINFTQPSSTY